MNSFLKTIKNNSERIFYLFLAIFFLSVITLIFMPLIKEIKSTEFTTKLINEVLKFGKFGWVILFLAQVLQVVVAIIPGGPFEIVSGMIYGPWLGTLILTLGGIFASFIIFRLCKKYGRPFVLKFFKEKHLKTWSWLENEDKLEIITFIVYLIPGTPKDLLVYLLGTTKMSTKRFLFVSNLGRIPALFVSCSLGSSITEGNYQKLIIMTVILLIFTIFSFLFRERIISYFKEKRLKKNT